MKFLIILILISLLNYSFCEETESLEDSKLEKRLYYTNNLNQLSQNQAAAAAAVQRQCLQMEILKDPPCFVNVPPSKSGYVFDIRNGVCRKYSSNCINDNYYFPDVTSCWTQCVADRNIQIPNPACNTYPRNLAICREDDFNNVKSLWYHDKGICRKFSTFSPTNYCYQEDFHIPANNYVRNNIYENGEVCQALCRADFAMDDDMKNKICNNPAIGQRNYWNKR